MQALHADEHVADESLVTALLRDQHPALLAARAGMPLRRVTELGTDHVLFRLGDDLVVRMPRVAWAADQATTDARWLPVLAPHLPLAVPVPVATGEPGHGYPFAWSVVPWIPGEALSDDNADEAVVADQLAGLVRALRAVDPKGGPVKDGTSRGVPLARLDENVRRGIPALEGLVDTGAVLAAWEDSVSAPAWSGQGRWIHGDLLGGNLLVREGRLAAVIDFGALGVGDPAVDLHTAFALFGRPGRERFRRAAGLDEAAWRRARGWALAPSVSGIPYYAETVPAFADRGLRMIASVLEDLAEAAG